jgi:hypothetical protein
MASSVTPPTGDRLMLSAFSLQFSFSHLLPAFLCVSGADLLYPFAQFRA